MKEISKKVMKHASKERRRTREARKAAAEHSGPDISSFTQSFQKMQRNKRFTSKDGEKGVQRTVDVVSQDQLNIEIRSSQMQMRMRANEKLDGKAQRLAPPDADGEKKVQSFDKRKASQYS